MVSFGMACIVLSMVACTALALVPPLEKSPAYGHGRPLVFWCTISTLVFTTITLIASAFSIIF